MSLLTHQSEISPALNFWDREGRDKGITLVYGITNVSLATIPANVGLNIGTYQFTPRFPGTISIYGCCNYNTRVVGQSVAVAEIAINTEIVARSLTQIPDKGSAVALPLIKTLSAVATYQVVPGQVYSIRFVARAGAVSGVATDGSLVILFS